MNGFGVGVDFSSCSTDGIEGCQVKEENTEIRARCLFFDKIDRQLEPNQARSARGGQSYCLRKDLLGLGATCKDNKVRILGDDTGKFESKTLG